jgi:hypothetical protein
MRMQSEWIDRCHYQGSSRHTGSERQYGGSSDHGLAPTYSQGLKVTGLRAGGTRLCSNLLTRAADVDWSRLSYDGQHAAE